MAEQQQQQQPQQPLQQQAAAAPAVALPALEGLFGNLLQQLGGLITDSKNQSAREEQERKWSSLKWKNMRNHREAGRYKALQRAAAAGPEHVTRLLELFIDATRQYDKEPDWRQVSSDLKSLINDKFPSELARGLLEDIKMHENERKRGSKRSRSRSRSGSSSPSRSRSRSHCSMHPSSTHTDKDCWSQHPHLKPNKGAGRSSSAALPASQMMTPSFIPMPQYYPHPSYFQQQPSAYGAPGGLAAAAEATAHATTGGRLQCTYCSKFGHTIDGCWQLHPEKKPKKTFT
jgi:hypothetical protein